MSHYLTGLLPSIKITEQRALYNQLIRFPLVVDKETEAREQQQLIPAHVAPLCRVKARMEDSPWTPTSRDWQEPLSSGLENWLGVHVPQEPLPVERKGRKMKD